MVIKEFKEKNYSAYRWILKLLLNVWTILTITMFSIDFFSGNKFDTSASSIGIIYIAILGIYAGEKEYTRWKKKYISNYIGELFIIIWTVIMVVFVIATPLSQGAYIIPGEFAVVYTSIIGVFAITARSKALRGSK